MEMTKFNFHGKLLENDKRVLTTFEEKIDVDLIVSDDFTPSGILEVKNPDLEHDYPHLKLSLRLPAGETGEKGDKGDMPTLGIGSVEPGSPTEEPKAEIVPNLDKEKKPYDYLLNLKIPEGIQGRAPNIDIGTVTYTRSELGIESRYNGDGYTLNFRLPDAPKVTLGTIEMANSQEEPDI